MIPRRITRVVGLRPALTGPHRVRARFRGTDRPVARTASEAIGDSSEQSVSVSGESDVVSARVDAVTGRRLELVVESVDNLAHDLGNALMSLTNYTELAMHPDTERGRRELYASRLGDLAYSAIDLVRQLRAVASTGGSEPRPIAISELIAPAVAAMKSGMRHRRVELATPAVLPEDRVRVRPDDAIHAVIDLLDVARSICLGGDRVVELAVVGERDRAIVRASVTNAMRGLDDERLVLLRAIAARAGAELIVSESETVSLGLALHRAD